jgi:hypothetical protein
LLLGQVAGHLLVETFEASKAFWRVRPPLRASRWGDGLRSPERRPPMRNAAHPASLGCGLRSIGDTRPFGDKVTQRRGAY